MDVSIHFSAKIWLYNGQAAWHFITVPSDISAQLTEQFAPYARGFRSLKAQATIGQVTWDTSFFPDTKHNGYLLPIKKSVRTKNGLHVGDICNVTLKIIM